MKRILCMIGERRTRKANKKPPQRAEELGFGTHNARGHAAPLTGPPAVGLAHSRGLIDVPDFDHGLAIAPGAEETKFAAGCPP